MGNTTIHVSKEFWEAFKAAIAERPKDEDIEDKTRWCHECVRLDAEVQQLRRCLELRTQERDEEMNRRVEFECKFSDMRADCERFSKRIWELEAQAAAMRVSLKKME